MLKPSALKLSLPFQISPRSGVFPKRGDFSSLLGLGKSSYAGVILFPSFGQNSQQNVSGVIFIFDVTFRERNRCAVCRKCFVLNELHIKFVDAFTATYREATTATLTNVARTASVEIATTLAVIASHTIEAHTEAHEEILSQDSCLTVNDACG